MLRLTLWSACTVTPLIAAESYAVVPATLSVYVSGVSDTNENRPDASVVVLDACDGLVALTRAP